MFSRHTFSIWILIFLQNWSWWTFWQERSCYKFCHWRRQAYSEGHWTVLQYPDRRDANECSRLVLSLVLLCSHGVSIEVLATPMVFWTATICDLRFAIPHSMFMGMQWVLDFLESSDSATLDSPSTETPYRWSGWSLNFLFMTETCFCPDLCSAHKRPFILILAVSCF